MDHDYEWIFTQPEKNIFVNMKNFKDGNKVFNATLTLERKEMNLKNLFIKILRYPFMTALVVFRIHYNAAKLWIKGAQFFIHPNKVVKRKI